jgi:steroid 5-alpha reductase family enzyme
MNQMTFVLGLNLAAVLCLMCLTWLLSLVRRDASIADVVWGLGFVLAAWLTFFQTPQGALCRKLLLCLLTTVWGLRLALYIALRKRGKGEDPRYRAWREQYGSRFWWVSLFKVFLLQGLLLWVISLATQIGQFTPAPGGLTGLDMAGLALWITGFFFEAVGDLQMARFKGNPDNKGKVMDRGLWAFTRHPNYFGESVMWWGLFLITLSTPGSAWTIISPALITFLLLRVSGVTLLEKGLKERRPAYQDYIARTSSFFPWFPGKRHHG